jgi:hypothetical protein
MCVFETGYGSSYVGEHKETLFSNYLYYLTSLMQLKG